MVFLEVHFDVLPIGLDCPLLAGQSWSLAPLLELGVAICKAALRVQCWEYLLTTAAGICLF